MRKHFHILIYSKEYRRYELLAREFLRRSFCEQSRLYQIENSGAAFL